jgi:hypothetical protein
MVNPSLIASDTQCIGPHHGCATVQGHSVCLWLDDRHLLAPDSVIEFLSATSGGGSVAATVKLLQQPLAKPGVCAGRFPSVF